MSAQKPYVVAKANRATKCQCKDESCAFDQKIEKGSVRFGTRASETSKNNAVSWKHVDCVKKKHFRRRKELTAKNVNKFVEFDRKTAKNKNSATALTKDEVSTAKKKIVAVLSEPDETKKRTRSEKAKARKRLKIPRDPNRPKNAQTAYFHYSNSVRNDVRAENPDKSMIDVSRIIGKRWKTLTDAEKQPFVEAEKADKERYRSEMESYKPTEEFKIALRRARRAIKAARKKKNLPKRPRSAYIFFSKSKHQVLRKEHPENTITQNAKLIGQQWRSMDDAAKKPFVKSALEDRKRYEREIAKWRKENEKAQSSDAVVDKVTAKPNAKKSAPKTATKKAPAKNATPKKAPAKKAAAKKAPAQKAKAK